MMWRTVHFSVMPSKALLSLHGSLDVSIEIHCDATWWRQGAVRKFRRPDYKNTVSVHSGFPVCMECQRVVSARPVKLTERNGERSHTAVGQEGLARRLWGCPVQAGAVFEGHLAHV